MNKALQRLVYSLGNISDEIIYLRLMQQKLPWKNALADI
jgi:hypothetical protein